MNDPFDILAIRKRKSEGNLDVICLFLCGAVDAVFCLRSCHRKFK